MPGSQSGPKRVLGSSRDTVHALDKGEAAPLRWNSESSVMLPASPLQAGDRRGVASAPAGPGSLPGQLTQLQPRLSRP